MKPEYREGSEAAEKFEEAMKLLFRTPKPKVKRPPMEKTNPAKRKDRP